MNGAAGPVLRVRRRKPDNRRFGSGAHAGERERLVFVRRAVKAPLGRLWKRAGPGLFVRFSRKYAFRPARRNVRVFRVVRTRKPARPPPSLRGRLPVRPARQSRRTGRSFGIWDRHYDVLIRCGQPAQERPRAGRKSRLLVFVRRGQYPPFEA